MNIGLVTGSVSRDGGGVFEAVRHLALNLTEHPEVDLAIYGTADSHTNEDLPLWLETEVNAFETYGPTVFGYCPKLQRNLQRRDFELLHSHGLWNYTSLACRQWARKTRRPYLVSPHGTLDCWALNHSKWKKRLASSLYERNVLSNALCLHALNQQEAEAIRNFGLKNPIAVIPNGVDYPQEVGHHDPPSWAQSIQPGTKVLLFLGRLNQKKGVSNLLNAWSQLQPLAQSRAWHLVLAGWNSGTRPGDFEQQATELGIQKTTTFIGPQYGAQKAATLSLASAFILPSFSEGLPIAVLEAWAQRVPVLMTPECNLSQAYKEGAAHKIATGDDGIREGLLELFEMSNSELKSMGEKGRAFVQQHFSWPMITRQMIELYNWLLGGGPSPSSLLT